jgi:hypothetical protein
MDGQGKWSVEAKEFELVVRGGNTGVRFYERNSRTVRSIFLQRAEVAWMDNVMEELAAVKFYEVFWDQSRAGHPRVIVEKCSNRHGKFLRIEEIDGRKRRGSIMIPEGRYGEGWNRLKMEVSKANSSLGVREKWRSNMVKAGKSYAEAVLAAQPGGHGDRGLKSKQDLAPARNSDGSKTNGGNSNAARVVGEEIPTAAGVGNGGTLSASISNPKERSLPANSGMEALSGRSESAGDGAVLWGQRDFRVELQELKNFLTKLKEDVDKGIRRVEEVMGLSGFGGLNMGNEAGQELGCVKAVGFETLKPKKRKNKSKKKNKGKKQLSGPKSGDLRPSDDRGSLFTRAAGELRSFQVGESSAAGAARAEGDMGSKSQMPSILGKFEWVRKAEAPVILSARGSVAQAPAIQLLPAVGDSEESQTTPVESLVSPVVMGSAVHGQFEEGFSTQVAPVVMSGSCVQFGKAGPLVVGLSEETQTLPAERPTSKSALPGDFGVDFHGPCGVGQPEVLMRKSKLPRCLGAVQTEDCLGVPVSVSAGVLQPLLGGDFSEKPNHVGVEASMLVPWQSGKVTLDSSGLGCFGDGEPIPLEICFGRDEGNGEVTPSRLHDSLGMELVPFVDGVPISQDWLLAMDDSNSGGCQEGDKGMEIIMAFRQIVGVSCDGHVERLRAAFAHILAGKKKEVKKNRGGGQVGRKGTREVLNLFTSVNYDGGSRSVSRSRGKGRGNRFGI